MTKHKNVTFHLPPELIERYKSYVSKNIIPSVNAGVKEALEEYAKGVDKAILKQELQKAAKDPMFLEDLKKSMKDFEAIDYESSKGNSEW